MARKKLNKKVAIIGSLILALFLAGAVVVFLRLTQDPKQFIKEGDIARETKDYKNAQRSYRKAFALAKETPLQIEIAFKLADLYIETDEWMKAAGLWSRVITLDPKNVKARQTLLDYIYESAENGLWTQWRVVESNCSDFIDLQPNPQLFFRRGRARFEIASRGQTTDRERTINEAIEDLEKALQLEPTDSESHRYLAKAILEKGNILFSKGSFSEADKSIEEAKQSLKQAINALPDEPKLYTELITVKMLNVEEPNQRDALESEYMALLDKFSSSPEVYISLSRFYMADRKKLDNAIEAIEKALELDRENVDYIVFASELYYRRALLNNQEVDVYKAMEVAGNALDSPSTQDISGPRRFKNRMNRLRLNLFLGNCWIERALAASSPDKQSEKEEWLARASKAVHEIQQIYGSRENPQALMWEGRLAFAKGQRRDGIKQMYAAYEQLKTQLVRGHNVYFAYLCYTLAGIYKRAPETGACADFLRMAIEHGLAQYKPVIFLDYAAIMLNLGLEYQVIRIIDFYEDTFSVNETSSLLYSQACNKAGLFDKAEERLAKMDPTKPDTIRIKLSTILAKLRRHVAAITSKTEEPLMSLEEQQRAEDLKSFQLSDVQVKKLSNDGVKLIETLLQSDPNYVDVPMLSSVCNYYVNEGNLKYAKQLIEQYLGHFPDNTSALIYKAQLYEPEPNNISPKRLNQITEEVLSTTVDELHRYLSLGVFHKDGNRPDEASAQYQNALEIDPCNSTAILGLFDIAMKSSDFETVEELVQTTRRINIDGCDGQYLAGRLALARHQFKDAVEKFSIALKERPVFSQAYLFRSIAHHSLGNIREAVADVSKASTLNPMDGNIARRFAGILYDRSQKQGTDISPKQFEETQSALLRAAALNPGDTRLIGLYAMYISEKEPLKALAYRQRIQKIAPSLRNALNLANLATNIAMDETNTEQKQALLDIATSAFEQAHSMDPGSKRVLQSYARFYRRIGEPEKAEQLLAKAQDKKLMWKNYISTSQFEKAGEILQQLYQAEPNDIDTVKGLLVLAERTGDKEGVMRYSDEVLKIESTTENFLYQIQAMLQLGILAEAGKKLESFNEKYPGNEGGMQLQALLALKTGQFNKALELTNKVLEIKPKNDKAWHLRGRLHHLMGNYTQAIRDLQKSKALHDSPDVRIQLAKTCLRLGRADDAITELNTALNDENAPVETRRILEEVYLALGRTQELLKLYNETIRKYPEDVAWHSRAASFMTKIRNFEQAEWLYLKAWQNSQRFGGNFVSLDGYLMALKSSKKYDRLFRYARRYIDNEATAPIAFGRMAEAKVETGDKVTAAQYYQNALEKAGNNSTLVMAILNSMHSTLGKSQTEAWCQNKLQAEPDSFVANFTMFSILNMSGEYNKALGYIDKCLQTLQDDPKKETFVTLKVNCLQSAYARTSDNQYLMTAVSEYKKLLEKSPNNIGVLNNLAYMLADNNQELDKALGYAQHAHNLIPDSPDVMDTYAFVLYQNGKYQQATEIQRSAIQIFEQGQAAAPPETYYHLGMIVEKLGGYTEALAAYKQALQLGQDKLSPKDKQSIEEAVEQLTDKVGNEARTE